MVLAMAMNSFIARSRYYPVKPKVPMRDIPRMTIRAFPRPDAAGHSAVWHLRWGNDADRKATAAAAFYALFASTVLYRTVTWNQL